MAPAPPFLPPVYQPSPLGQQPSTSGNPVGAVFLGFFASVVVSLLYSGVILATYKDQSLTVASTLYLAHAVINGAVVGALIGAMAHRSVGAQVCGAFIAALGAFFGYANALPFIVVTDQTATVLQELLKNDPFFPAKAWWHSGAHGDVSWISPLGLVLAGAIAWGLAHVIGNKRHQR
jgi:hypothetical protein